MKITDDVIVTVRRDWYDRKKATTAISSLRHFYWRAEPVRRMLFARLMCDQIIGDIGHSCAHRTCDIAVCILRTDNREIYDALAKASMAIDEIASRSTTLSRSRVATRCESSAIKQPFSAVRALPNRSYVLDGNDTLCECKRLIDASVIAQLLSARYLSNLIEAAASRGCR